MSLININKNSINLLSSVNNIFTVNLGKFLGNLLNPTSVPISINVKTRIITSNTIYNDTSFDITGATLNATGFIGQENDAGTYKRHRCFLDFDCSSVTELPVSANLIIYTGDVGSDVITFASNWDGVMAVFSWNYILLEASDIAVPTVNDDWITIPLNAYALSLMLDNAYFGLALKSSDDNDDLMPAIGTNTLSAIDLLSNTPYLYITYA